MAIPHPRDIQVAVVDWLDARYPFTKAVDEALCQCVPNFANAFYYCFGGMVFILIVFQLLTGILLSLYYVQGLTLAQIARMRDVHEATASRRLHNIRLELRRRVESLLASGSAAHNGGAAAKGLSPAEVRRCLDYALEDWSFDLASGLAENALPGTGGGK